MKKKIYFICPDLGRGGAERVVVHLLKHLNRDKYLLHLVLFKKEGLFLKDIPGDVPITSLDKRRKSDFLRLIFVLAFRIFSVHKPALIISFLDYTNLLVLVARLFAFYKPVIILRVGTNLAQDYRYKKNSYGGYFRNLAIRFLYPLADKIIAVSQGTADILSKRFRIDSARIRVIYNGIDKEEICRQAKEKLIPFVPTGFSGAPFLHEQPLQKKSLNLMACGRLIKAKNYPLVLKAYAMVKERLALRWHTNLYIIGEGPERSCIEALIDSLALNTSVHLLGFQSNPFKFLARADIFLFSSWYEGFPNILLEAMACRTAIIATDCPSGPGEMITHGVDGLLVPVNGTRKMAEAILTLAFESPQRIKLAMAAERRAADFNLGNMVKFYEQLAEELFVGCF